MSSPEPDGPEDQLKSELRSSVARAIAARRPILTHVNADTTWLLQLPRASDEKFGNGRGHFNILIDPWLTGPQSDVAAWFSTQWHIIPSSVQSIAELEERLRDVEELTREIMPSKKKSAKKLPTGSYIDAVAVCHEFTDHCHEATLREIDPCVPVFANDLAAQLIRGWNHFDNVYETPIFGPGTLDWRDTSTAPLPEWIGISRIQSPNNALYYHSAILITVKPVSPPSSLPSKADAAEAIIYSPHGVAAADLENLTKADPPIRTLALLHGLHDVSLPRFQLNLGAHNGVQAHRATKPKYWLASHDEQKKGGGMIGMFLNRKMIPLKDAVDKATAEDEKNKEWLDDINFMDMQSGESLLLE